MLNRLIFNSLIWIFWDLTAMRIKNLNLFRVKIGRNKKISPLHSEENLAICFYCKPLLDF